MQQHVPVGSKGSRYLVILIGVVAGYVIGQLLETRFGWQEAGVVTGAVGGLLAGIAARFTLFRDSSDTTTTRR